LGLVSNGFKSVFIVKKSHVSSMNLEGVYSNLYSGVIQLRYIKLWILELLL